MSEIANVFNVGDRITVKTGCKTASGRPSPVAGKVGQIMAVLRGNRLQIDVPGLPVETIRTLDVQLPESAAASAGPAITASAPTTGEAFLAACATAAPPPAAAARHQASYGFDVLEGAAIVASLTNPRTWFDPAALQALADNIRELGLAQPILVRRLPGARLGETWDERRAGDPAPTHEVVAGERRWRACRIAGVRSIPVLIRELTDEQVLDLQLVENVLREDLHPLEEAHGYRKILDLPQHAVLPMRDRVQQLADRIKKSTRYIYQTLQLLQLCDFAQKVFLDGSIRLEKTTALAIATIGNEAGQIEATRRIAGLGSKGMEIVNDPMSQRAAADYVKNTFRLVLSKAPFPVKMEYAGIQACTGCPKMSSNARELFEEGTPPPDTCMDPSCYGKKNGAHQLQLAETAKAKGQRVITGKAAKKLFPYSNDSIYGDEFEALDERQYGLIDKANGKTLEQALGNDMPAPVLIERPDGKGFIKALPKKDAQKLLKERGLLRAPTSSVSDSQRKAEQKAKAEKEYRWAVAEQLLAAVDEYPQPDQTLLSALQVAMAMRIYSRLDHESSKRCRKLLGWEIERGFNHERASLLKHFQGLDSRQFNRFVVAACIADELHYAAHYHPSTDDMEDIAALLKVDPKAIRSHLEAANKAQEKQKAATKGKAAKREAKASPAPKKAAADKKDGMFKALQAAESLKGQAGATEAVQKVLADFGVDTLDDLADMTVDELAEVACLTPADARAVVTRAREGWFAGAPAAPPAPSNAAPKAAAKKSAKAKPAEQQQDLELPVAKAVNPQDAWPFPIGKETPAQAQARAAAAVKANAGATA